MAPEATESRPGTKREHRTLVLYPVLSSPPGDCRPRLSTLAGLFSALLRPCLSLGDALGQLLAAAAHIGAAAPIEIGPEFLEVQDHAAVLHGSTRQLIGAVG